MVRWHEIAEQPGLSSQESLGWRKTAGTRRRLPSEVPQANSESHNPLSHFREVPLVAWPGAYIAAALTGWPLSPLRYSLDRRELVGLRIFVDHVLAHGFDQQATAPGLPCKTRASSIWLERPEASEEQNVKFRLKPMITQHQEIMTGKTPGLFPTFAGCPLFINGKLAPRSIPDTVAVKQPSDPKKEPKVRFCRNATAAYTLSRFSIAWLARLGLAPTDFGFAWNESAANWEAPGLNDTVNPRFTTISFPKVLDLAAMTLLCWMLSLLDWKGAFRQLSLSPDNYHYSYYVVATCMMLFAGLWREMELVAIESRLFFGGAGATSAFSVFPITHCRGCVLAERNHFRRASPRKKWNWRWAYSVRRMGPCKMLPKGNRPQDFGLALVPEYYLPRAKIKVKNGKRVFPVRPQCSQALKYYRAFRLNHSVGSFLNYVDDAVFGGNGMCDTSSHKGDFFHFIEQGKLQKKILFAEAEKVLTAEPGDPVTFGGIKMYPQPFPRLGLPEDKRLQYIALIELVLKHHHTGCVPFTLLETLLGKLSWWANIDKQVWCFMVPLQWHCAWFIDLFEEKPTDPRTLASPGLEPLVIDTLSYLLSQLKTTGCWVDSRVLVHLPLLDGCVAFIADAAGHHKQGIGLLLLGQMSKYCKNAKVTWEGGGDLAYGLYPTDFECNLRQNSKEMLGVLLGALRWASLAKKLGLPLVVLTDNAGDVACMTVHCTIRKARCGSCAAVRPPSRPPRQVAIDTTVPLPRDIYTRYCAAPHLFSRGGPRQRTAAHVVWRIFRAVIDLLRPMGVSLFATWISGAIIPADPLSRSNEEPKVWQDDLRVRCNRLGIPMPHIHHNKLAWSEARRRIGQICCFSIFPSSWSQLQPA